MRLEAHRNRHLLKRAITHLMDDSTRNGIIQCMAQRKFTLTEHEIGALRQAADQTQDARELKRLQAVRLYGEGRDVADIVSVVDCTPRSLLRWCAQYRAEGVGGLPSKWRGGNAAKLTREQREAIKAKLHSYRPDQLLPPNMRVSQGAFWTVSDLRIAVQEWYGVSYQSENSYYTLLHESGFSLQRPEKHYRSRPDEQTIADFEAELEKK